MNDAGFTELYPFASHYLDLDGLRYHYLDEGTGPVVLMLHGNPTWSFYYRRLALALRDRYRVIVPDHIGCGFSDKPQDYPYRLATHIANLRRLVEHLQLTRFSLVVHDWGGPIGCGFAVTRPECLHRLVVLNTTIQVTTHYPRRILLCRWPLLGPLAVRGLNGFARAAVRLACTKPLTPAVKAGYLRPYDSYAHRIAILRFVQDIPLGEGDPSWATAEEIEAKVSCLGPVPKLICWGQRDFCFTQFFLDGWRARFPDARVHVFPEAGHYVLEDAFDEILPLVQAFLAE